MFDPAKKSEADQNVRTYLGEPQTPAASPLSPPAYRYRPARPHGNSIPAPREDGIWLPTDSADERTAAYPPAPRHYRGQQKRNPPRAALPDRVNETARGREGVWGDEGSGEIHRGDWLAQEAVPAQAPLETTAPFAEAELRPQDIAQGIIWAVVLGPPPGRQRSGRSSRRRIP
jgi:hypothetical protein